MKLSLFLTVVALVIFSSFFASGFTDHSLVTLVEFKSDGSAKVTEKITVTFDSESEREAFTNSMANPKVQSTIIELKKFSKNVDYHVTGAITSSTRITAKRDFTISYPAGNIILEYDTVPIAFKFKPSSRATRFSFNTSGLNFQKLQTGQVVLGQSVRLAFRIPSEARFTSINPQIDENTKSTVSFLGPMSAKIAVEFEIEKSLSQEVTEFFSDLTANTVNLVPVLLALAFIAFFAYKLLTPKKEL